MLQETFLKISDKAILKEINDLGWNILSDPRKHRRGGGIAVLYKPDLVLKNNDKVVKYKSFQVMEALLECDIGMVRLINIYRPPYTKKARFTESFFLEEFDDYLSNLSLKPGVPLIAGDFNIHVERPNDHYPKMFLELISTHNLLQCVPPLPTHNCGGTLDLILTTQTIYEKIRGRINILDSGTTSDHYLVWFDALLKTTPASSDVAFTNYRNFKALDVEHFKEDIMKSDLGLENFDCSLDDAVSLYNNVLTELMNKHCPVISRRIKTFETPWRDLELRELRRKRRAAERAWRKGTGEHEVYAKLRKKFEILDFQKRCNYNRKSLEASSGDSKTLYKKIDRLLGNVSKDLPSHEDPALLAENFKNFFSEKVNNIRNNIEAEAETITADNTIGESPLSCEVPEFNCFTPITLDEIQKLITKLSNKCCDVDPIPTFLLKKCSDVLSPIIHHIMNSSLRTSIFPAELKKAIVNPILKTSGADKDCLKNYRPVSNLSIISKLLEKVVLKQLNEHLDDNGLHSPAQSGYRPFHSCETLHVKMSDDIIGEIQDNNIVILVLLDLSAAFDTIDHGVLLEKLDKDYNIKDNAQKWFKSYLENRSFSVKVKNISSSFLSLMFGVPQGSILGPILFILYVKQLEMIAARYGISIKLYADDSQLYISFHPMKPCQFSDVIDRINTCLAEIKAWMVGNFMKLNEGKTELLLLGKTLVLQNCNLEVKLQFGSTTITPTECKGENWKSLGVKLDSCLNMERQINSVRQSCYWTFNNIQRIGYYLDEKVKLMLVKQLIISKLDYCNALYMNLPKTRLNKLGSILNHCVRYVYNIKDMQLDLIPYYKRAHILTIDKRVFFKVCLLAYKVVYNIAPAYLSELVSMEIPTASSHNTRTRPASDDLRMILPKVHKNKSSDRRFSVYAPESWNSLPYSIRCISSIESFKTRLKTHLFNSMVR